MEFHAVISCCESNQLYTVSSALLYNKRYHEGSNLVSKDLLTVLFVYIGTHQTRCRFIKPINDLSVTWTMTSSNPNNSHITKSDSLLHF